MTDAKLFWPLMFVLAFFQAPSALAQDAGGEWAFQTTIDICQTATSVQQVINGLETADFTLVTEEHADIFFQTDGYQRLAEFAASYVDQGFAPKVRRFLRDSYAQDWKNRVPDLRHRQTNGFGQNFAVHLGTSTLVSVRESRSDSGSYLVTCGIRGDGGLVFDEIFESFAPVQATSDPEDWIMTRYDSWVRETGGFELAKSFIPQPIEDIYGMPLVAKHFLLLRSEPFTR